MAEVGVAFLLDMRKLGRSDAPDHLTEVHMVNSIYDNRKSPTVAAVINYRAPST
jgi:hypothetical protein